MNGGEPRRDRRAASARPLTGQQTDDQHAARADQRLCDLDARRHVVGRRATAAGEREKRRVAWRAAEWLHGAVEDRVVVDEPAAGGEAPREREVLTLVARERLVDPIEEAERQPQRQPDATAAATSLYLRPSKRNADTCSDTSPTKKMMTASMMSRTDEFVTWRCVAIVHTA